MPNWVTNRIMIGADGQQLQDILAAVQREGDVLGSFDFNRLIPMPKSLDVTRGSITDKAIHAFLSHLRDEVVAHPDLPGTVQDLKRYADAAMQIKHNEYFPSPVEYMSAAEITEQAERHNISTLDFLELGKQYLDNQLEHGAHTWYDWCIKQWSTKWNCSEGNCLKDGNTFVFDTAWSAPENILKALSKKFPTVEFCHGWADEDLGQNVGESTYLNGEAVSVDIPPPGSARAYEMTFDILERSPEEMFYRLNPETGTYEFDEDLESAFYNMSDKGVIDITDAVTLPEQAKVPLPENVWITVYKDTLGHGDDHDNLTQILVPSEWLTNILEAENTSIAQWFDEYTADHTDSIARKAITENQILDCADPVIKSKLLGSLKPGLASQIQSAASRTSSTASVAEPAKERPGEHQH